MDLHGVSYVPILHDISANWRGGQIVGIVGPNGAGKSTLLRLMAGIWTPTDGLITIDGQPLTKLPAKARARRIAYLPQQIPAECPFTVAEFVEMGRYAHRTAWGGIGPHGWQVVREAVEQMGLTEYQDVPLTRLSGGERQRAGVARCLAQESPVMLLDEPISNLDVYYQIDMLERLREFTARGHLIIVSIHHLEFAARYCSEVLLLHRGRVYAQGDPEQVLTAEAVREVFGVFADVYRDPYQRHLRFSYRP
jgi:ABC-type cobalamin/Fe3+-siderophores transport system ATPase subunit